MASAWALLNEIFMIASSIFAGIGWYHIKHRDVHRHRRMMVWAASLGAAFFVSYVLGTLLVGDSQFGGPQSYAMLYQVILQIHVMLATIAAVLGVLTVVLAVRRRFHIHRKIAPWTAILWFVSAGTGLIVYLMLFVIFPPGPSVGNLLHLILSGH